jgi:hypothetical protein
LFIAEFSQRRHAVSGSQNAGGHLASESFGDLDVERNVASRINEHTSNHNRCLLWNCYGYNRRVLMLYLNIGENYPRTESERED